MITMPQARRNGRTANPQKIARRTMWSVPTVEGPMILIAERVGRDRPTILACAWEDLAADDIDFERHQAAAERIDADEDPVLRAIGRRVQAAVAGEAVDFNDLRLAPTTAFFAACRRVCQDIPAGATISYAELARRAGSPNAARAAGQAMRRNPTPIIVPCHRVVASDGQLGGYGGAWSKLHAPEATRAVPQRGAASGERSATGWGHRNCDRKARLLAREAAAAAPSAGTT